jgi:hypothetical protein
MTKDCASCIGWAGRIRVRRWRCRRRVRCWKVLLVIMTASMEPRRGICKRIGADKEVRTSSHLLTEPFVAQVDDR